MPASQPVTETIILHLKEGIKFKDVPSGTVVSAINASSAVQAFAPLVDAVKAQEGFIRQYLGHQVEDPHIFVWSIDWESFEHSTAFVSSGEYRISFMAGMGQVFDLDAAAPLTFYTRFNSDASMAFAAPVTEVAFFTVPNHLREEAEPIIEAQSLSTHPVFTVGKSTGGAIGWVFDARNAADASPEGHSVALHGVFGYASVDDHVRWRQTPEHAQVIEDMGRPSSSPMAKLGLGNPRLPGGNIFVPDSSMFHVKFSSGGEV